MVINKFVHVEGSKDVECMAKVKIPWNHRVMTKDWKEVRAADYGVDMDDGHHPGAIVTDVRFNNPHAIVGVGVVERFAEKMDERT